MKSRGCKWQTVSLSALVDEKREGRRFLGAGLEE